LGPLVGLPNPVYISLGPMRLTPKSWRKNRVVKRKMFKGEGEG